MKDGPATLQVGIEGIVGDLPDGTLLLGRWQLGDNRLFGTFTEKRPTRTSTAGNVEFPVSQQAGL